MQPLGVALVPHATDPDICYIWVRSYTWHGTPLVVGVQTSPDGYFEPAPFSQSTSLPAIGSVPLNISTLFTTSTLVRLILGSILIRHYASYVNSRAFTKSRSCS